MAIVSKGNSRTRLSGASPVPQERAGAVMPEVDERTIWFGRDAKILSIPNEGHDTAYMRVDVANLDPGDYQLTLEQGVLNSTDKFNYPVHLAPNFTAAISDDLEFAPFASSQQRSGAMFAIPPQSRVHIALRVMHDRSNKLAVPVAFCEHASLDIDSPPFWPAPAVRTLEWIPAPSAEAVTCTVFSPPHQVLFWDTNPEADRVYFRPWNVGPKAGRFPWSLGLFHHPECVVRITNGSPFAVKVAPRFIVAREDEEGKTLQKAQEELLANATLEPGEEREWPIALSLADIRLPRQEAEQMRIRAVTEVFGPSATLLDKVNSPETIKADYQAWPTKLIDWIALVGGGGFLLLFLLWTIIGIPVHVKPSLEVSLHFRNTNKGELPANYDPGDKLDIQLTDSSNQEYKKEYDRSSHKAHFDIQEMLVWQRWPLPWAKDESFKVQLIDQKGLYTFKDFKQTLKLNQHEIQDLDAGGGIEAPPSKSSTNREEAGQALSKARDALHAASQLLNQSQPAKAQLSEASQLIGKADGLLTGLGKDVPEKNTLDTVQGQLVAAQQKEDGVEKNLSTGQLRELSAEGEVKSDLTIADNAVQAGHTYLNNNDKPGAATQKDLAESHLQIARSKIGSLTDTAARTSFSSQAQTTQQSIANLSSLIIKVPTQTPQNEPVVVKRGGHVQSPTVYSQSDPILQPWQRAYEHLLNRKFDEAIRVANVSPDDPKALAIIAIASEFLNNHDDAKKSLEDASQKLGSRQSTDAALVLTAQGFVNNPMAEEKIQDYDKAISMDPTLSLPYLLKVRILVQLHEPMLQDVDNTQKIRQTIDDAKAHSNTFRQDRAKPLLAQIMTEPQQKRRAQLVKSALQKALNH